MAALYDDPDALAEAIKKARAPRSQDWLAKWLGVDRKTVIRWEKADVKSLGETIEKRRAVAVLVAEATGRRDLLGLSEPTTAELDLLGQDAERLKGALRRLAEQTLQDDERAEWLRYMPNERHYGVLDPEEETP